MQVSCIWEEHRRVLQLQILTMEVDVTTSCSGGALSSHLAPETAALGSVVRSAASDLHAQCPSAVRVPVRVS